MPLWGAGLEHSLRGRGEEECDEELQGLRATTEMQIRKKKKKKNRKMGKNCHTNYQICLNSGRQFFTL